MPDAPSSMTIRFSCDCGASFQVPKEQAGRLGRCGKCGKEIQIPDASEPPPTPPPAAPKPKVEQTAPPAREPGRFCPFCGRPVRRNAGVCPSCLKSLNSKPSAPAEQQRLSTVDWVLSTVAAPLGCIGGFILLVMGNRKGLNMLGISTVGVFVWWCVALLAGWIR